VLAESVDQIHGAANEATAVDVHDSGHESRPVAPCVVSNRNSGRIVLRARHGQISSATCGLSGSSPPPETTRRQRGDSAAGQG
jgi:hypothetical protein